MPTHHIGAGSEIKIDASVNDLVEVELDEVPTSGYKWAIANINNDEIELVNEDYELYKEAGIGGGGKKKFTFKILKKTPGRVRLENRQPWGGDVYKTFEFNYR